MKHLLLISWILFLGMATAAQVITINEDIQLLHLKDSVYIHRTWHYDSEYGRFPSNGMILIRRGKALMIDTPNDNAKTELLVKGLKDSLSAYVTLIIPGHFHNDCIGGLEYLHGIGVSSLAGSRTVEECRKRNLPLPGESFKSSKIFDFGGEKVECRYFGPGHTIDNIVVWLPEEQILFGGCLVKSAASTGLGNLTDAVVEEWDATIRNIRDSYKDISIVVPGHGDHGGPLLLDYTVRLVEEHKTRIRKP